MAREILIYFTEPWGWHISIDGEGADDEYAPYPNEFEAWAAVERLRDDYGGHDMTENS